MSSSSVMFYVLSLVSHSLRISDILCSQELALVYTHLFYDCQTKSYNFDVSRSMIASWLPYEASLCKGIWES